ncbi:MAG: lamin tail domain-containing protein, partial [Candidatus Marinimicrobia bacterium]|nr:lamin tail domain-containing protein [Candidatus Neomarinimicrobiota bacterium]
MKAIFKVALSILFCISSIFSQGIVFNEVMSSNVTTLIDEDGEYPDWIEVYNSSDAVINLDGYGISDDENDPLKWIFPDFSLGMHQFMVLFASGKDRKFWSNHWETVIDWGDIWKYRLGNSEPPANWREVDFDDSNWSSGATSIGYGDDDDATAIPSNTISFYIRKIFTVDDVNNITQAILHVDYDDAFVAHVNGIEVARANITGSNPPHNQSADWYIEPKIRYGKPPEKFILESIQDFLVTGENVLAIQVHNYGTNSSDLTIIPFLTLGMNEAPPDPHGAPEILQLPLSFLHTNFKISSNGETLIIADESGQIIDQIETGQIHADISRGRYPDGDVNWFFFEKSTPGEINSTQRYQGVAESPQFSQPGGFYSSSLNIEISTESSNAVIFYTTDG